LTAIAAFVGGGAGGLGGAFLAQSAVSLAHRLGLASSSLQGKWGPPFLDIALFVGVLYGAIAAGLSKRWKLSLAAAALASLGIIVPLFVLERTARMGWGTDAEYAGLLWRVLQSPWYAAVIFVYAAAVWGTIAWLGRAVSGRRRGAAGAVAGAFAAYLALSLLQRLDPALDVWSWRATEFLPQLSVVLDGLLTGAGLGIGIWIATRRKDEKVSGA
jgi:hypothetical protein